MDLKHEGPFMSGLQQMMPARRLRFGKYSARQGLKTQWGVANSNETQGDRGVLAVAGRTAGFHDVTEPISQSSKNQGVNE